MNSLTLLVGSGIILLIAYICYGGYLAKKWGIDDSKKTPAHTKYDGVDYVPAKAPILLGHHFASIAGVIFTLLFIIITMDKYVNNLWIKH